MKKSLIIAAIFALAGCDGSTSAAPPMKASYSDIQQKFAENGESANRYYSTQPVELTDTVNSVKEGGLLFLVDDKMEAYGVLIASDDRVKLKSVRPGDKVTVACSHVDATSISQCKIVGQ